MVTYLPLVLVGLFIVYSLWNKKEKKIVPTPTPPKPKPNPNPKPPKDIFHEIPVHTERVKEDSIYAEIINRTANPYLRGDRSTQAHETVHEINSVLRNSGPDNQAAFFFPTSKAFLCLEPRIKKHMVAQFVPENLRFGRYATYVVGQKEWDNKPLYILDEWSAYLAGASVIVDDLNQGRYKEGVHDGLFGVLEFSVYSIALCIAIRTYALQYWNTTPELHAFVSRMLSQSSKVFHEKHNSKEMQFKDQEVMLTRFRASSDASLLRTFCRRYLNTVWLQ